MSEELSLENEVLENLKKFLGDKFVDGYVQRKGRVFVRVKMEAYKEALKYALEKWNAYHLSTISGVDKGEKIELLYHLLEPKSKLSITIGTEIPKSNPKIGTVSDIFPSALVYEREVYDLLGVTFEGHPSLKRLVLPEDWPEGVYPLRKDWKPEQMK
ncbi:MAG: NADH-quinone oxidoreductase subunit C [Candidatus Baldrarchaeia archaeon]